MRIIAGAWRGRPLIAPAGRDTRPTSDRAREGLFSMLTSRIGSFEALRVADLCAGTGALGLEALSRGAAHVPFVETGRAQCDAIRRAIEKLGVAARAEALPQDALGLLRSEGPAYDVAFLDPPFDSDLLERALERLPRVLKPGHRLYLEWPAKRKPRLPENLHLVKEKKAGQVSYALANFP